MTSVPDLPKNTLASEEMPSFYFDGPYDVGRDYGGRVAHIYQLGMERSLCGLHFQGRYSRLSGYAAGERTCMRCLSVFRQAE